MKILLLHDQFWDERGGAVEGVRTLARGLVRAGCDVTLLTTSAHRQRCGIAVTDGITVETVHSNYATRLRPWISLVNPWLEKTLLATIRRCRPDVMHTHTIHGHWSFAACRVAARAGVPVIYTAHDTYLFHPGKWMATDRSDYRSRSWRTAWIRAWINRYVRRVLCVSRAIEVALAANGFERLQTVYNGTDIADAPVDVGALNAFRRRFRIEDRRVILHGGRLGIPKGTARLIDVLAGIRQRSGRPVTLLLAGEANGYLPRLQARCAERDVAADVVLLGWVDRATLQMTYAAADICVTPSLYMDPCPFINIEAMAMGKPVVGTCFGGTSEVVEDGQTGYIVDPRDPVQLAGRLAELLNDPAKARAMGERGAQRVAAHFHADRYTQDVLRVYGEVLRG